MDAETFWIGRARHLVRDLMQHNPVIYFTDFILSAAGGYYAAWQYFHVEDLTISQLFWFLFAGFALFRAGAFIHEIVHMPSGRMKMFKAFWNVSYGVPMLTPSFMYHNHPDHHTKLTYGTGKDGEYQPFAHGSWWRVFGYFAQVPLLPILGVFRFLILGPLSLIVPPLRYWVLRHASSYVSNPAYVRDLPRGEKRSWWGFAELGCFCIIATWIFLFLDDTIPWSWAFELYLLSMFAIGLNWTRNLAAHRFRSRGHHMTHEQQFYDSVTIVGKPMLNELLFPVGLRYHAVHHLFPGMPYHNLAEAHRRLLAGLPNEAGYRTTLYRGFWHVMRSLAGDIRSNRARAANARLGV